MSKLYNMDQAESGRTSDRIVIKKLLINKSAADFSQLE
jgi:hypothetical protein